jgi:hypothetical protein
MAEEALQPPLTRPSPIAIHDDGNMLWQLLGVQLPINGKLLRGQFMNSAGSGCTGQGEIPQLASTVA